MIVIDKGTDYKLLVITSPNCSVCREMQKSDKCNKIPLTRYMVLAPSNPTDELAIQTIFKTKNPLLAYKQLLSGQQISQNDIDWNKNVDEQYTMNMNMFDQLSESYDIQGTPAFFILDKNDTVLEQIKLEIEPADVLRLNIEDFLKNNK